MADSTQNSLLPCKPRCKVCNNLDHREHQDTHPDGDQLLLHFPVPELKRDCQFCSVIISSIETIMGSDWWNARQISQNDKNEKDDSVMLIVRENSPIVAYFYYDKTDHTEAEIYNTEKALERVDVKFMIYSSDEVCFSPKPYKILILNMK